MAPFARRDFDEAAFEEATPGPSTAASYSSQWAARVSTATARSQRTPGPQQQAPERSALPDLNKL